MVNDESDDGAGAYDSRCDIWSLAITAIELAEGVPPLTKHPPMKALMMIPSKPPPTLPNKGKRWSPNFVAFVKESLVKDFTKRPRAMALTLHKWIQKIDRKAAMATLEEHCSVLFPYVMEEEDDEWHAEGRRISVSDQDQVATMVMNKKRGIPMKKEAFFGDSVRSTDNLATLNEMSEEMLTGELKKRYDVDVIYTLVGDILIACNPYKRLDIYDGQFQELFVLGSSNTDLPPHVYGIAQNAYKALQHTEHNQCCVISGESGAGKTETCKLFMKQLLAVANSRSGEIRKNALDEDILSMNPLLEAFGNAKTAMNANSSRFGKFLEINFDKQLRCQGASISEYLLEKSRVARQGVGERNFHVFYLLLAGLHKRGADVEHDASKYRYLGGTAPSDLRKDHAAFNDLVEAHEVPLAVNRPETKGVTRRASMMNVTRATVEDAMPEADAVQGWEEMEASMKSLKFTATELDDIERIVFAILLIGNITFKQIDGADNCDLIGVGALMKAAEQLKTDPVDLCNTMQTSVTVTRGEKIVRLLTVDQAEDSRDAASKALYSRLFVWLVARINTFLTPSGEHEEWLDVGVLDIFGFENFEHNSFEQLCINVANEQLQFYFNQHIFAWELEELAAEGIPASRISFVDNKPLLDLFLQRPVGLLALLDDESVFPKASDYTLTEKFHKAFKKEKKLYTVPKVGRDLNFQIIHYAGSITYGTPGFLEKNRDSLSLGIHDLFDSSEVVSRMVPGVVVAPAVPGTPGLATAVLGQGINNNAHRARNQRPGGGEDALDNVGRALGSARRGMSMRKGRASMYKRKPGAAGARGGGGGGRSARGGGGGGGGKKKKKSPSVSATFKASLADLMTKMMSATPHFIRCIKPNGAQQADEWDAELVLRQLTYTGVCETVRIRRDGYPVRLDYQEFVLRYQILAFDATREIASADTCAACVKILSAAGIKNDDTLKRNNVTSNWEIGKTKIFLKYFVQQKLTEAMDYLGHTAITIQRWVRGFLARKKVEVLKIARQRERELEARKKREREEKDRKEREEIERKEREEKERIEKEETERIEKERVAKLAKEKADAEANATAVVEKARAEQEAKEAAELHATAAREVEAASGSGIVSATSDADGALVQVNRRGRQGTVRPISFVHKLNAASAGISMKLAPLDLTVYDKLGQNLIGEDRLPKGVSHLNRYNNILPNPRSRVRIPKLGNDETTTYINANYITSFMGVPREYVPQY